MTPPPTRLRVLFARENDFALVLRRGPARHVAAIAWDRSRDTFKLGQWLKARIDDADLSPDGHHFLYYASKYDPKEGGTVTYTVISRAPYFTALHYWAPKQGIYGGVFFDDIRFGLRRHPELEVRTLPYFARQQDAPESKAIDWQVGVETYRRERDGWKLQLDDGERRKVWHKTHGDWTLAHSIFHRRDKQSDLYELLHAERGAVLASDKWDWADIDRPRKRLCFALEGQLWTMALKTSATLVMLHNFSDMQFEQCRAPYRDGGSNARST